MGAVDWMQDGSVATIDYDEGQGKFFITIDDQEPVSCDGMVRAEVVENYLSLSCVVERTLEQKLQDEMYEMYTLPLNPKAALFGSMIKDGYVPVTDERDVYDGEQRYVAQLAIDTREHLPDRIYYVAWGDWNNVLWMEVSL